MAGLPIYFLATSELLSTFFPTWLWQGREWRKGRIPRYDRYYWNNAVGHPVLSSFYPPHIISSVVGTLMGLEGQFNTFIINIFIHIGFGFISWFWLFHTQGILPALFGALTITFGSYSLKQQPCIIYTLAWFPLTLYHNPIIASVAVGMMLLAGYYPFAIYLLPVSVMSHIMWYRETWLLFGLLIGLPQLIPFLRHLPKTIKRINDKCEETPAVERRFYVGVIPILLLPFSTSRIWPLTVLSALLALGLFKEYFPRVHERWLIVLQFCIGYTSVNSLSNLQLSTIPLAWLLLIHAFDLFWHNSQCLPPRPYCELWQRPSRVFNTKLTRFLEANLGDYKVSGLPWPLFTGHVNNLQTIGYCGSMQTKEMWNWRKSFRHDPFIDGVDENELTRQRVKYAFSRQKLNWPSVEGVRHLYRNPNL